MYAFMARAWLSRQWTGASAEPSGVPLVIDEQRVWALPRGTELDVAGMDLRVNDRGMRGGEVPARLPGEVRLMTLGDSSVFGYGVRETEVFSVIAAEQLSQLSQRWQRPVLSLNGAVPGHDSGQSRMTLRTLSPDLSPDWVVIGSLWSDVYRGRRQSLPPRVLVVRGVLRELALYRLLQRLLAPVLSSESIRWIADAGDISPLSPDALDAYRRNLRAMARDTSQLGGCPVFVMLPAPMDFDVVPVPEAVAAHRGVMRAVASETGAPLLDGPALLAGNEGWRGLFIDQVHPSATGHARLGMALAAVLAELGPECS